jgi:hypothetical protein
MKRIYFLILLTIFTGCTPHLTVNVVQQPEINIKNRSISIISFKNDFINLSDKIKYSMPINNLKNSNSELSIEGFVYNPTYYDYQFTKKEKVIEKFYVNNERYNEKKDAHKHDNHSEKNRNYTKDNNGDYYFVEKYIDIQCIKRTYTIDSSINIIENSTNRIIFNEHISSAEDIDICDNFNRHNYQLSLNYELNNQNIYNNISNKISKKFTDKLIEHSFYKNIEIIKEPIFKSELVKFTEAVDKLKNNDLISSEILFKSINDPAAYYNLGLINESKGNYFQALSFYEKAEIIPSTKESIRRVKSTINAINNR